MPSTLFESCKVNEWGCFRIGGDGPNAALPPLRPLCNAVDKVGSEPDPFRAQRFSNQKYRLAGSARISAYWDNGITAQAGPKPRTTRNARPLWDRHASHGALGCSRQESTLTRGRLSRQRTSLGRLGARRKANPPSFASEPMLLPFPWQSRKTPAARQCLLQAAARCLGRHPTPGANRFLVSAGQWSMKARRKSPRPKGRVPDKRMTSGAPSPCVAA